MVGDVSGVVIDVLGVVVKVFVSGVDVSDLLNILLFGLVGDLFFILSIFVLCYKILLMW